METNIRLDIIFFGAKEKVRYKIMENWNERGRPTNEVIFYEDDVSHFLLCLAFSFGYIYKGLFAK